MMHTEFSFAFAINYIILSTLFVLKLNYSLEIITNYLFEQILQLLKGILPE